VNERVTERRDASENDVKQRTSKKMEEVMNRGLVRIRKASSSTRVRSNWPNGLWACACSARVFCTLCAGSGEHHCGDPPETGASRDGVVASAMTPDGRVFARWRAMRTRERLKRGSSSRLSLRAGRMLAFDGDARRRGGADPLLS